MVLQLILLSYLAIGSAILLAMIISVICLRTERASAAMCTANSFERDCMVMQHVRQPTRGRGV